MANEFNPETRQLDPVHLSAGSTSTEWIGLAVAAAVILGVVFYGLNAPTPAPQAAAPAQTASSAANPAPQTSKATQ
jgi:prolipoprotein diacylglyceryltransferase